MRTKLAQLGEDARFAFRGEFKRYGYKHYRNHYSPTLLLQNVQYYDENDGLWRPATDHLWFSLTKGFQKLGVLQEGDLVQLNARVSDYYKGYFTRGQQHDLKLAYPTKIKFVEDIKREKLPDDKNAIVGLIMNLYWDFYISHDRPIDSYCLEQFALAVHHDLHPYGIKEPHYDYTFNDFYEQKNPAGLQVILKVSCAVFRNVIKFVWNN